MNPLFLYKKNNNLFVILSFILLFRIVSVFAQEKQANVVLENAESLAFDKTQSSERQVLRGNVRFRHQGAVMYCDSAYFYSEGNSLDAFGHVRMVQGDTLFVYSDLLFYNGNTQMALLRKNVRMVNKNVILTTDSLNYDRKINVGYYFTGGTIKNESNVLVSQKAYYYPNSRLAEFKENVVLTNPDFTIKSDTLKYNTQTEVAYLVGPSNIVYKDTTHIYSELGVYNTKTQKSSLFNRSYIETKDGRFLTADSIFYDRNNGIGKVYRNAIITDTVQHLTLKGNIGFYNSITNNAFITDSALVIEHSSADSLFLHADSLYYTKDSSYNLLRAYHNVRFFRKDIQGKCDSISYSSRDSIMTMHYEPVLWSDNNQLSGDSIKFFMKNGAIDYADILGHALAAMQDDSIKFNQLVGKQMRGYIRNNKLYKVEVSGNTQSIYFPRDEDSSFIGMNKTESSFMIAYLKDSKIDKIILYPQSNGKLSPIESLLKEDLFFPEFKWYDILRPKKKEDIFIKTAAPLKKEENKRVGKKKRIFYLEQ